MLTQWGSAGVHGHGRGPGGCQSESAVTQAGEKQGVSALDSAASVTVQSKRGAMERVIEKKLVRLVSGRLCPGLSDFTEPAMSFSAIPFPICGPSRSTEQGC